jgi:MFS superfamily sulfate permease-like transporter
MKPASSLSSTLKAEPPTSVGVFLVGVPLCLGIALDSGAPLFSGIIAGIVRDIVVGALSGSHLGVSGPAAGLGVAFLFILLNSSKSPIFVDRGPTDAMHRIADVHRDSRHQNGTRQASRRTAAA